MKILLVQCPCSYGVEMPFLGLAYLSSYLKINKYDSSILDLSSLLYKRVDEKCRKYWESNNGYWWYLEDHFRRLAFLTEQIYENFVQEILSREADIIGFSVQSTAILFTLEVIKRIKEKNHSRKIILGGPHCYNISNDNADFALQYDLHKFADAVVVGEGERALLTIVQRIEHGNSLDGCKGVAYSVGKNWILNGFADPVLNLDELPFPDFSDYDFTVYINKDRLPILTSRGCIMKCVFCTDTYFWSPFRYRSPENILMEIMQRQKVYNNSSFSFNDSLMNGNYRNLFALCNLLIDKKISIHWGGNFRIARGASTSFLKKMKEAGCTHLIVGIESASNKILKFMGKHFSIEDAQQFINDCHKVGIDLEVNWIVGFPGETEKDFMKTAKFIEKNSELIRRNNFTTLAINQFSYLAKHMEAFGIVLDGGHLGLWRSADGLNTIKVRTSRVHHLENIEAKKNKHYNIVRQSEE